jgi:hypothetical protein
MEAPMRGLAWMIFAAALILALPARAQTHGGGSPFCIQAFGLEGGGIDCSFASMEQCRASASGRSAQCINNPNYAGAGATAPARRKSRN